MDSFRSDPPLEDGDVKGAFQADPLPPSSVPPLPLSHWALTHPGLLHPDQIPTGSLSQPALLFIRPTSTSSSARSLDSLPRGSLQAPDWARLATVPHSLTTVATEISASTIPH